MMDNLIDLETSENLIKLAEQKDKLNKVQRYACLRRLMRQCDGKTEESKQLLE